MERFGVSKIGLYGSITRNDFCDSSDIDIIVSFNRPVGIEFIDLAEFLEKKLSHKIDLVSLNAMNALFYSRIENEIIYINPQTT